MDGNVNIDIINPILFMVAGGIICYLYLWVSGSLRNLEDRVGLLEEAVSEHQPTRRHTNVEGQDCDPENDEIKGSIGYK